MRIKDWFIENFIKDVNDKNDKTVMEYNNLFKEVSNILADEKVRRRIKVDSELKENTFELYKTLKEIFIENI